jgi:predicted RNase H-like HicB family nuclease
MAEPGIAHRTAVVVRDERWCVARCPEVEVTSQGESVEDALDDLREALELCFEDAPVVEGSHPIVAPIDIRSPA